MRELSLFSGAGGGLLGTKLLGWEHCGYVEFNEYCQKVIKARIKDGILEDAPLFTDVRGWDTIDWVASMSADGGIMAARRKEHLDQAVLLYESGFSVAEVARHYGVTRQSLWESLKRRGCQMRSNLRYGKDNHFWRGGGVAIDRVHNLTEQAILRGVLHRPDECEECGASGEMADGRTIIQAHHSDYNKPLEVNWLCQKCHHEWHSKNKPIEYREDLKASDKIDVVTAGFP